MEECMPADRVLYTGASQAATMAPRTYCYEYEYDEGAVGHAFASWDAYPGRSGSPGEIGRTILPVSAG